MNNIFRKLILTLGLAIALSACGGGGGGGGASGPIFNPNISISLQATTANLLNTGYSVPFTISGWVNSSTSSNLQPNVQVSGNGTLTAGPVSNVSFTSGPLIGQSTLQQTQVFTGSMVTGTTPSNINASTIAYFSTANYTELATYDGSSTMYIAPYNYPATVSEGATGSFGNGSTNTLFGSTSTTTYKASPDTQSTMLVTEITTVTFSTGGTRTITTNWHVNSSNVANFDTIEQTQTNPNTAAINQDITYTFH